MEILTNNVLVLGVIAAILLFLGLFGIVSAIFARKSQLEQRVRRTSDVAQPTRVDWRGLVKKSEGVIRPLGELIPRSPEEMSRQERRLVKAGIRRKDAAILFMGIKAALAILLLVVFTIGGYMQSNPLLYVVLAVLLGALVPDAWLSMSVSGRRERIQLAIPDALDLTVVCVEAGMGLDQALQRVGQELGSLHQDLSDELRLLNLEVRAGKSAEQSYRNLANRTDVDDLRSLVAVLNQTRRFGTSVAQSLRVFSESLRTKRRQRAEERAAKTTIKMIPPLVFFILPAIFVVVLGPAIITLVKHFLPSLGNQ